jgi:hypothetical protein
MVCSPAFIAWVVPDLALTFALVTLISLFFMLGGATALFSDTDTGWHIRNGEHIIMTGLLPHADPYSFSKPGQPWIAWEWGADVLMGAVYRVAGLGGVALMYGVAIAASVWMWFRLNQAAGGNTLLTALLLAPTLSTSALHWLARPHVFSWLFLLGTVWICEKLPARPGWRHFTPVALGTALWASLHASFFFAPMIALIYAAGAYLAPLIWTDRESVIPGDHESTIPESFVSPWRSYIWLALAASVGTLLNPNGWRLHQHVFSYLSNSALLDQISEFQSFNFHLSGAIWITLTIAVCFGGAFAALAVRKPGRFLLSIMLTAMALRSVRVLPLAALLLLPLANGSITEVLARAGGLRPALRRRLDDALKYGDGLAAIDRSFRGLALVPLVVILVFASIRAKAGFAAGESPVAASVVVASLPASARILAPDSFGGYLIFRFHGERKVFFDGRSDFYGKEFLDRYLRLAGIRPGWRDEFNRWHFTHALLPPDCSLIPALESSGWHELYRDRTAVLLTGRPVL